MNAVAEGEVDKAKLPAKERGLLDFVELLTRTPSRVKDADVERLRRLGWSDGEVFEAAFDTALFAFFNRMSDAFGLDFPVNGWHPPAAESAKR